MSLKFLRWRNPTVWTIALAVIVCISWVGLEIYGTNQQLGVLRAFVEVLTIVALFLAWIQLVEARQQTLQLKAIQESLSNRFLASFPRYIDEITSLIDAANRSLVVFCDVPAYGGYSASSASLAYQQAIRRAAERNVDVTVACYDSVSRKAFNRKQFEQELKDWAETTKVDTERVRLERLLKATASSVKLDALTGDQFIDLLDEQDVAFLNTLGKLVRLVECPTLMSIYFWIRDGQEAVFAVPSSTHESEEYGFKTEDARLVASLLELNRRYCAAATSSPATEKT